MQDEQIVALYLRRCEDAIAHTAQKYGRRLHALAYGIVGEHLLAEECENDTYLQAWNSIPPHKPCAYLYAFLARITRHVALNRLRAQRRGKRSARLVTLTAEMEQCLPAGDDAAGRLEDAALAAAINGYLANLSVEQRCIFLRRYWYLDSIAAIASRFALSQSKVKVTLYRCRLGLKAYLQREGYLL